MLDTSVVIVGAGPTGMSAAIALARHGVASTLLERRTGPNVHPKARGVRLRTMEILRGWGLAEQLEASALPEDAQRFIYCDSVAGDELGRTPDVGDSESAVSPSRSLRVPQNVLESALLQHVMAEPLIDLRWDTAVVDLTQTGDLVHVQCASASMTCAFVIGADGAGSKVRSLLGVQVEGDPLIAYWQSIYWRGQIAQWVAGRSCIQFHTGARQGQSLSVAPVDGGDRWITMRAATTREHRPDPLDPSEAIDVVRQAVGVSGLDLEVLDVAVWRVSATVARTWKVGRVLLAGDAAHTFPPTGGFGLNAGVQDAHNLAWKLGFVLGGQAGPALLDTYEQERKPVAIEAAAWSLSNGARNRDINLALARGDTARFAQLLNAQRDHVLALNQDLGYAYRSSAVQPAVEAPRALEFVPIVEIGRRAPHAWLKSNGARISTLDLFGSGFTLLVAATFRSLGAWSSNRPSVAVLTIGEGQAIAPMDGTFDDLYQLDKGALLVRPDGHVAWRFDPCDELSAPGVQAVVAILVASASSND